jgi:arsenate reductase
MTGSEEKARVLFVCTHNSARSQMAEGFLRHHAGYTFEAFSAGTEPGALNPLAAQAMAEDGIDISRQQAKSVDAFLEETFDYVVTVCDDANETCPVFPNARNRLHWSFPDPSRAEGTAEERLAAFRSVRDDIEARVERFLEGTASDKKVSRRQSSSSKNEERDGRHTRMGI